VPALALEGLDLVAIAGLLVVIGLLIATKHLLQPLAGALINWSLDVVVWSGHPLAWLGHDIEKWIIAGIDSAIAALGSVVEQLWSGLTWAFGQMLDAIVDVALKARSALVYAVDNVIRPWAEHLVQPIRADATKAVSELESLGVGVARASDLGIDYATQVGAKLLDDALGYTAHEVKSLYDTLHPEIASLDTYVHGAEAAAEAIPGTITADFDSLWKELQKYIRPEDLGQLLGAGLLSGMLLRVIAQNAGLDSSECQSKHKQICGVDPSQWTKLLEGLALLGFALDFKQMYDFAYGLTAEIGDALVALEDKAWSEFA